jgi:hypothetical protein
MRHGTFLFVNLQPGEFVFFSCYAAVGLVPLVSFFLFTLLEFYGLQLQHLSPHSLILVAIFIHFCKMFVYVWPSVSLFRLFHVLQWSGKGSGLIGDYYFYLRAKVSTAYIGPISLSKWDRWREDWVIIRANIHDRMVLPTESPTAKHSNWEEVPKPHWAYEPVIERVKHLTSHGLTSMMVLHDFLSRCITPLQDCAHPTWLYTREGDTTRLERGCDSNLAPDVLNTLLGRLSPDPSSVHFITPLVVCAPMCPDQAMRMRLLRELPTLDNIDITARQRGDESWGIQIPKTDVANSQGGASTVPGSSKGKGKVASSGSASKVSSRIILSDTEVLSDDDLPLQRRKRLYRSDGSTVGCPPLSR